MARLGLEEHTLFAGSLPPGSPLLSGLLQSSTALLNPSLSETFGLTILEAYAAGVPVLASKTSGVLSIVEDGKTGWLFGINDSSSFAEALKPIFEDPARRKSAVEEGLSRVAEFDVKKLAGRVKNLYETLLEKKRQ